MVEQGTQETDLQKASAAVLAKISDGKIKFSDLVKALAPADEITTTGSMAPPEAVKLTDEQQAALDRLPEVFGKVQPAERRVITQEEIDALMIERQTIDEILKMAEGRKEGIKNTVHVHLDVEAEVEGTADKDTPRHEKHGFYILDGEITAENGKKFAREVRSGSPKMNPARLEAIGEDPEIEEFTRKDYLAMTTQVRVFDEAKAMLHLKKNPALVKYLQQAIEPGKPTAAINIR